MPVGGSRPAKLRGAADFRSVLETGRREAGRLVAAHVLPSQPNTRVGFVAGRAVGGAVVRNRARRLMREAWRAVRPTIAAGAHVVFVARRGIRQAKMGDVAAEMTGLLRRSGLVEE